MLKKLNALLSGVPMTAVGGVFLLLGFVLPKTGINLPIDPAWATIFVRSKQSLHPTGRIEMKFQMGMDLLSLTFTNVSVRSH